MCVCAQLMLFGVEEIPSFKLPKGSSRRSFFNSFILVRRFARVGLGKCILGCFELISKDLTLIESCALARCVELSLSYSSMHCQPAGSHSCECFFFFLLSLWLDYEQHYATTLGERKLGVFVELKLHTFANFSN